MPADRPLRRHGAAGNGPGGLNFRRAKTRRGPGCLPPDIAERRRLQQPRETGEAEYAQASGLINPRQWAAQTKGPDVAAEVYSAQFHGMAVLRLPRLRGGIRNPLKTETGLTF